MTEQFTADQVENALRRAIQSTANQAADIAQRFQPDASMEDADPRVIALLKIAISDEIRRALGGAV